jgi:hypothetical protein
MARKTNRIWRFIVWSNSNNTIEKITDSMLEKLIDSESISYIDWVIISSREIIEQHWDQIDWKSIQIIIDIQKRIALIQSINKPWLLEEFDIDVTNELLLVKSELINIVSSAWFDVMQAWDSIHFVWWIQIIDKWTTKINVGSKPVQKKHLLISWTDVYISDRMFDVLLLFINSSDTSIDFELGSIEYQFYIRLKRVLVESWLLKLVTILERKRVKKT